MTHSPTSDFSSPDVEEDAVASPHYQRDEDQQMRLLLLRLERRLVELNEEMGLQENIHNLLRQQQEDLEASLVDREHRLAEAHETISSLESERESLQQHLQALQEETERERRKLEAGRHTCPQSTTRRSGKTDAGEEAGANTEAHCSRGPPPAVAGTAKCPSSSPQRLPAVSVRLVDCWSKLRPDGCVNVAQQGHLFV